MKKISNSIYRILALLSLGIFFVTCNNNIEDLGAKVKPVLTSNGSTSITVSEGTDAVLSFKLDKAINEPIQYRLVLINDQNTAADQIDYIIPGCRSNDPDCFAIEENGGPLGYVFEIPAYTKEYSVNISTILDDLNESNETLKLQVISNRTLLGKVDDLFYNITITNTISNDLNIRLNWGGTFKSEGLEVENCDLDMDLELYNSNGDLVESSYENCPESLVLNSTELADGTYTLFVSLWTTDGYLEPINIPANIQFIKPGTNFNETYNISSFFPMQDGGIGDGNPDAGIEYTIVKSGLTYSIKDKNGSTVFAGKNAFKTKGSRKN